MTFKHSKFEDSVTMRSLERIAKANGWVKPEPITKSASGVDLTPSISLVENVLKLCAGLRQAGFEKYAGELESKLLSYKQAQTLYEVSKEKGEDLVDAAHPKGSHKLENVEGDEAVFETIVDRHMKMLEKIEKMPTGKLASSRDVIGAVKVVLAQDADAQLSALMAKIRGLTQQVVKLTESDLTVSWSYKAGEINELSNNPTIDNLKKMREVISQQRTRLKPGGLIFSGITEDNWARVSPKLDQMDTLVNQGIDLRNRFLKGQETDATTPAAPETTTTLKEYEATGPLTPMFQRIGKLKQRLRSAGLIGSVSREKTAMDWIKAELAALDNLSTRMRAVPDTEEAEMAKILGDELSGYEKEVEQFYNQWVQVKA